MRFLEAVAGIGVASALLAAAASTAAREAPQPAKAEEAQAIISRACVACHDLGVLTQSSHSAEDWPILLQRMVSNGANLSPEDLKTVQDYLVATYAADH